MRKSVLLGMMLAALTGVSAGSAVAYENFIPLGTGYSTEVDSLPRFDSERGEISQTTDVLESEVWRKNREAAEFDSQFRMFMSNPETEGDSSTFIDY